MRFPEEAGRAAGAAARVATAVGAFSPRKLTIWPSVLSAAMRSASTSGVSGAFSRSAERISTRLMESMPRSASRFISRLSISVG